MGALDTGGTHNFYVEDCDFHMSAHVGDPDANARAVVRHCVNDHAAWSSHGADSGPVGMRHIEFYDNSFLFINFGDNDGSKTVGLPFWFFMRGGCWLFTDNLIQQQVSPRGEPRPLS